MQTKQHIFLFELMVFLIYRLYPRSGHSALRLLCWGMMVRTHQTFYILPSPRLKEAEKPFCERLYRIRDLMDRSKVSIEEVICELGKHRLNILHGCIP